MSDERDRLAETEELDTEKTEVEAHRHWANEEAEKDEENDVQAHVFGSSNERDAVLGGDNALGGDNDRGRLA